MNTERVRRLARLAGGDNPLRRRVDRAEAIVVLVLISAVLTIGPVLGLYASRHAGAAVAREMHAERTWHQVPAVLTQNAANGVVTFDGPGGSSWVTARWQQPAGSPHSGDIAVPLGARAGQRVLVWVTAQGSLTRPPLTRGDIAAQEVASVMTMTVAAVLAALLIGLGTHLLANRRRMKGWTRDWKLAGPRWTSLR